MRALPGRASRTTLDDTAPVTRDGVVGDQRRRILRATGELVAKRGYNAVTVELIVKRARVSFKTFYKHFPNKETCFLAFFDKTVGEGLRQVTSAVTAEPEAIWPEKVVLALHSIFETILVDPLLARAVIVEAPTVGPVIAERYENAINALSPLLRQGREYSAQSTELPETLEDTLAGGILWSAYQRLIAGDVDHIESLLPEAVEFVLRPYLGEVEAAKWGRVALERPSEDASVAG
jgi:AcrR family transcriptional regulator